MKNNYKAFLLIGSLCLVTYDANAGILMNQTANNQLMKRRMNSQQDDYQSNNRNGLDPKKHSNSGGFPTVDMANLMESIKKQNIPKTQDEKADIMRNIEGLRKSGNEITETIKPKKKP
jgi:hypothetical protein